MKISLYVQVHIKITPWKFHILDPKDCPVIYPWSLHFSYKIGYFWTYSIVYVCKQFLECTYLGKWKMLNCGICSTLLFIWRLCGQTLVSAFVYLQVKISSLIFVRDMAKDIPWELNNILVNTRSLVAVWMSLVQSVPGRNEKTSFFQWE